jgi:Ca2+-binding RTX toxin-like protein
MLQTTDSSKLATLSLYMDRSNFSYFKPLTFVSNTDLTSNFEIKAAHDYKNTLVKGMGADYFDALIGTTFNVNLIASYGLPNVTIFDSSANALINAEAEASDITKEAGFNFVAPSTGRYYLFSAVDSSDKNASIIVLEDQDTSPAYTPPAPKPVITPTPTASGIAPASTNNQLVGTTKSDTLVGGDGNDTLTGGLGFDTLTGGKGADKFVYKSTKDAPVSHSKIETITDFSHSEKDKINLSGIDADTSKAKDQAFSKPESGAEFSGVFTKAGQLFFDTTDHILYGSVNNDGAASFAIQLNGVSTHIERVCFKI